MTWFDSILGFLTGVSALVIPLLFRRKKANAEAETTEIANAKQVLDMWRETAESQRQYRTKSDEDNQVLLAEIRKLLDENKRLNTTVIELKKNYGKVMLELHALKVSYGKLEKNYTQLKKEIETNPLKK